MTKVVIGLISMRLRTAFFTPGLGSKQITQFIKKSIPNKPINNEMVTQGFLCCRSSGILVSHFNTVPLLLGFSRGETSSN